MIERWKRAAEAEPDARHRANYGGLAKVFADVVDRKALWENQLKEWSVKGSTVVEEWRAEGRVEGRVEGLVAAVTSVLEARYGTVPADLEGKIRTATDADVLRNWLVVAARVGDLAEFRAQTGL